MLEVGRLGRSVDAHPRRELPNDAPVHDVIAAITTDPWSIVAVTPSSKVTGVGSEGHSSPPPELHDPVGWSTTWSPLTATGSLAGNDSADASSRPTGPVLTDGPDAFANRHRTSCCADSNEIRSCGLVGPAIEGSIVARSSSTVWE